MYLFELVFFFPPDIYLGVELLGHMIVLFLVFFRTSIAFSTVATTVQIPTNRKSHFSISLPTVDPNFLTSLGGIRRKDWTIEGIWALVRDG